MANQKYTQIKNDFCITFDKNAEVIEIPDDSSINLVGYNFVNVKDIRTINKHSVIDVIGVCINPGFVTDV